MFRNYLRIACRNLFRHGLFPAVNILCLAIGITFSMIIGVYVLQQKKVNADLKDLGNQYYVKSNWKIPGMGEDYTTLGPIAKTMRQEYPGLVANYYRFNPVTNVVSSGEKHFKEDVAICDTTLVSMYGFPLLYGDKDHAFPNAGSALVTETLAMKLFGKTDVLGRAVTMQTLNKQAQGYTITGVLKDPPFNTVTGSFTEVRNTFGMFVPIEGNRYYPDGDGSDSWKGWNEVSFIELKKGISPSRLDQPFATILRKYATEDVQKNLRMELSPLRDHYIRENNGAVGRMVTTLSLVAVFILLMAVINFININIGTSAWRLKEIGLRKVFGSARIQLIFQFILESFVLTLLAAIVSLGFYELLRPLFNNLLLLTLDPLWQFGKSDYLLFAGLVCTVGFAAGIYPAFILSAAHILHAVKGKLDFAQGGLFLRKTLLVIQFTLAIVVFIGAVTVSRQVSYAFKKDLGFKRDQLLVITPFPKQWDSSGVAKVESIRQELMQLPVVSDGSLSSELPGDFPTTQALLPEGAKDNQPLLIPGFISDEHFASTFGLRLVEGTFFNEASGTHLPNRIVLNESAVKAFGWKTALGKQIRQPNGPALTVAGVVSDFNYASLQQSITPLVFLDIRDAPLYRSLTIRLNTPDMASAIEDIRKEWKILSPNAPFEYVVMDDRFRALYSLELQLRNASGIATALNLVIVFMGIFGVVALTLVKRSKEMAIRKVLGAGSADITLLFIRDYTWLLLIANLFSWPLAYLATSAWLRQFAYKVPQAIGPYLFVLVFIFVTVSLLVTVQCLKTARENPVRRLKAE